MGCGSCMGLLPHPISFSRSVTGSTTDFGSVSFGSNPDGKASGNVEKCRVSSVGRATDF